MQARQRAHLKARTLRSASIFTVGAFVCAKNLTVRALAQGKRHCSSTRIVRALVRSEDARQAVSLLRSGSTHLARTGKVRAHASTATVRALRTCKHLYKASEHFDSARVSRALAPLWCERLTVHALL